MKHRKLEQSWKWKMTGSDRKSWVANHRPAKVTQLIPKFCYASQLLSPLVTFSSPFSILAELPTPISSFQVFILFHPPPKQYPPQFYVALILLYHLGSSKQNHYNESKFIQYVIVISYGQHVVPGNKGPNYKTETNIWYILVQKGQNNS